MLLRYVSPAIMLFAFCFFAVPGWAKTSYQCAVVHYATVLKQNFNRYDSKIFTLDLTGQSVRSSGIEFLDASKLEMRNYVNDTLWDATDGGGAMASFRWPDLYYTFTSNESATLISAKCKIL